MGMCNCMILWHDVSLEMDIISSSKLSYVNVVYFTEYRRQCSA